MQQTKSSSLRLQGNSIFRSITQGLAPSIQASRLKQVELKYQHSLTFAAKSQQKSHSHKNLACFYIYHIKNEKWKEFPQFLSLLYDALNHLSKAKYYSNDSFSNQWYQKIDTMSYDLIQRVRELTQELPKSERLYLWLQLNLKVPHQILNCRFVTAYQISSISFKQSVRMRQKNCLQEGLNLSIQAESYLMECQQINKKLQIHNLSQLQELQEEQLFQKNHLLGLLEFKLGESRLTKALNQDDQYDHDLVKEALDNFKSAVFFLREAKDIESQAKVMSQLGKIQFKIFKNYTKAKSYLSNSISLGMSLHPKNVQTEPWYQRATVMLENVRNKILTQESIDQFQKKEVHLKKYKQQLNGMWDISYKISGMGKTGSNVVALLEYLKNTFPVKEQKEVQKLDELIENTKECCLLGNKKDVNNPVISDELNPEDDNSSGDVKASQPKNLAKILLKVIKIYHPDKHTYDGLQWKYLVQQITKSLNSAYQSFK